MFWNHLSVTENIDAHILKHKAFFRIIRIISIHILEHMKTNGNAEIMLSKLSTGLEVYKEAGQKGNGFQDFTCYTPSSY